MAFTLHFHTPTLLLTLAVAAACSPKLDGDDTGDETGITTTGDEVTSSGSGSGQSTDPTMPGATSTASTTGDGTATTATTTSGNPTTATSSDDVTSAGTSATSTGTSATTVNPETATATDSDDPVDPPQPCGGEATPQVGITTTMAYLKSQVPPAPDPTAGGSSSTGGREQDPGTLFVHFSDQAYTCEDPAANLLCGPHWSFTIVIPPEFQSPGLHNLAGQNVFAFGSETGVDQGMNECEFGGGTQGGTFEIFAIDEQTVEGRLCNLDGIFPWTAQLEGSFSAARCP